ncbi:AbrB/MazE/SpoVT family DNA-binding domain-containing protein [Candidatus Woesearchaeota archaeon]|nr:AbrB/MazE/SpoVT family DNA-binding domain-containing protein [Candidatus Woesearchaeota archaeon]
MKRVMSTRGRLTIPKDIRDRLGIRKGVINFEVKGNEVVIRFEEKLL